MNRPEPLRIAFLDDHLSSGGATVYLIRLLPRLRAMGLDVRVFASDLYNDLGNEFRRTGTDVRYYRYMKGWNLYDDRVLHAYRLLADFSPHVVVVNHERISFDLLRYVPQGVGRIAVSHSDNWDTYRSFLQYAEWIDLGIGVSKIICRSIGDLPLNKPIPVAYIPNAVEVPGVLPACKETGDLRILYIGRLVRTAKEVQRFIPIWQELIRRDIPVEWWFLGDGPERTYLMEQMVATARQKVSFIGEVPQAQVQTYCAGFDVVALVSSYEGLPIGVLEAMANGLIPVVTRQHGEVPDMVTSACGFCVPGDDPVSFVDVLADLQADRQKRASMRRAAYDRILSVFTLDRNVASWMSCIEEGAGDPVVWPAHVSFLGLTPEGLGDGLIRPVYYHRVLRPIRRLFHWCFTAWVKCGRRMGGIGGSRKEH